MGIVVEGLGKPRPDHQPMRKRQRRDHEGMQYWDVGSAKRRAHPPMSKVVGRVKLLPSSHLGLYVLETV